MNPTTSDPEKEVSVLEILNNIFCAEIESGMLVPPTKEEFDQICMEEFSLRGQDLFFPSKKP